MAPAPAAAWLSPCCETVLGSRAAAAGTGILAGGTLEGDPAPEPSPEQAPWRRCCWGGARRHRPSRRSGARTRWGVPRRSAPAAAASGGLMRRLRRTVMWCWKCQERSRMAHPSLTRRWGPYTIAVTMHTHLFLVQLCLKRIANTWVQVRRALARRQFYVLYVV